jgi:prepilin-type N-terminal cleavage/methylation domain-containing protein
MPTKTHNGRAARLQRSAAVGLPRGQMQRAFVLIEMVIVIFIIGLFVSIAMVNVMSVLGRNTFKSQANDLVATLRMAAAKAAESSRRYEIIIDFPTQGYTFREITSSDLGADVLQEEIIRQHVFGNDVHIKYVQFDDGEVTAENQAKFRAGHAGWQYGGKIVLVDGEGREYTIMVNRLNRTVELLNGDIEMLAPREDLAF